MSARICVIDDDLFARDALEIGLSDAGYDVVTAPGAAAGLDIVMRKGADAIVTDMNMPGTDGAQLIKQARSHWPDMPIIAITGASTIDERSVDAVARELGADAALLKPFRAEELVAVLIGLLARAARSA